MPTTIPKLVDQLRPAILRLARELRRESQRTGLSAMDTAVLASIKHNCGVGVSELAELEHMSQPSMSTHVKRLEEAGWVQREASACGDKRRVSLKLTNEGESALDTVRRQRSDWLASRLAELPQSARDAIAAAIDPLLEIAGDKP
jgi:DNA-binding MarR family transcriptional regulator